MGDSRYRGQYYSMFKNMDLFGELEQVIIKQQHNCLTDTIQYSGKFIPLEHEYLVILKKKDPYIIPVQHVKFLQRDVRTSEKMTWAAVLSMILEANGGRMTAAALEGEMEKHPKARSNNHLAEKLRQELQLHLGCSAGWRGYLPCAACLISHPGPFWGSVLFAQK